MLSGTLYVFFFVMWGELSQATWAMTFPLTSHTSYPSSFFIPQNTTHPHHRLDPLLKYITKKKIKS